MTVRPHDVAQRLERALEAGALAVEPVERRRGAAAPSSSAAAQTFSVCTSTPATASTTTSAASATRSAARASLRKFADARRVDEVDLGLVPLGVGEAGGERVLAGDLFFVVVGDRRAVVDRAEPVDRAGIEEQRGDAAASCRSRCGRRARHFGCWRRRRPSWRYPPEPGGARRIISNSDVEVGTDRDSRGFVGSGSEIRKRTCRVPRA